MRVSGRIDSLNVASRQMCERQGAIITPDPDVPGYDIWVLRIQRFDPEITPAT